MIYLNETHIFHILVMRNEVADFVGIQGLVWRLGQINWLLFCSALIITAWSAVVVFLILWWVCSRYLEEWRRVMMTGDGAELLKNGRRWWTGPWPDRTEDGEDERLRREAYGLPGGFLRRFWFRRKGRSFLLFLEARDRVFPWSSSREGRNFDEDWVKEVPVAERIRLDASLFPLRLVILADSLLQMRFRRERQLGIWSKLLKLCELKWTESLCSRV